MDINMLTQYIRGLNEYFFHVIMENEQEFIDKFVRADGDTRLHNIVELAVNPIDLLYAVDVHTATSGNVLSDAVSTKAVIEWVCTKKEGPDDSNSTGTPTAAA